MSPGHFSRSFRAAYGETPYSYLMTRRIERAKALLRRGDLSVTEVCFEVGCTSLGSFSTRFTELVGESPSAYRARDHEDGAAIPACLAKIHTRPIRNGEAKTRFPPVALRAWTSSSRPPSSPSTTTTRRSRSTGTSSGCEVRNDVAFEGMRWVTVGSPAQPGVSIVLEPPLADPNASEADRQVDGGAAGQGPAARRDLRERRRRRRLRAHQRGGAEVLQEPFDQPYGVRDCAFRDPSGNMLRFSQARG